MYELALDWTPGSPSNTIILSARYVAMMKSCSTTKAVFFACVMNLEIKKSLMCIIWNITKVYKFPLAFLSRNLKLCCIGKEPHNMRLLYNNNCSSSNCLPLSAILPSVQDFELNSFWPVGAFITGTLFIKVSRWKLQWSLLVSLGSSRSNTFTQFSAMHASMTNIVNWHTWYLDIFSWRHILNWN